MPSIPDRSRPRLRAAAAFTCLLAACGGPAIVPQERLAAEEQRFLRPFADQRIVVAEEVEIVVSPNFFNQVGQPALDPVLHARSHEAGPDGDEFRFVNQRGGVERPLRLLIGQTQYHVLRVATLRVLPSGSPMTMDVAARGDVTVLEAGKRRDLPALEVRDGIWRDR